MSRTCEWREGTQRKRRERPRERTGGCRASCRRASCAVSLWGGGRAVPCLPPRDERLSAWGTGFARRGLVRRRRGQRCAPLVAEVCCPAGKGTPPGGHTSARKKVLAGAGGGRRPPTWAARAQNRHERAVRAIKAPIGSMTSHVRRREDCVFSRRMRS